jgi:hypothetical protein
MTACRFVMRRRFVIAANASASDFFQYTSFARA